MSTLLVAIPLGEEAAAALRREYRVHAPPAAPEEARAVRAVVTNGSTGFSAAQMDALPALELICCYGAGYENVDLAAARERRICVTHAPGVNDATVADHALALMLAAARAIPRLDRAVRAGRWTSSRAERPALNGARLGLLGLGNIGARIARRAVAFDMTVGYHARSARADVPWQHYPSLVDLARASDFLVVACPGGAATRHLVDRAVLDALGPAGILVNVARGSIVDTRALIEALRTGGVAAAGLDVVEGEPEVPPALLELENIVVTPHVAGRSPAAVQAQTAALLANLAAHFAGRPLPSRVPAAL
jgi:lactate dehydrogenase-like 2-hydroxyacid dehydrogenase